jgi:uncharacterized repeat protein (TIGR01451 family)
MLRYQSAKSNLSAKFKEIAFTRFKGRMLLSALLFSFSSGLYAQLPPLPLPIEPPKVPNVPVDGPSAAKPEANSIQKPDAGAQPTPAPKPAYVVLPQDVQVVSIQTPKNTGKQILGPAPFPGLGVHENAQGHLIAGMQVGTTSIVEFIQPQGRKESIYASIEIFGHLHRPSDIDPLRYPLRVTLSDFDIEAILDQGRMITRVIYLEDPKSAIPYLAEADRLPTTDLNPTEDPFRIARALGRIMAVVRFGTRQPTPEEVQMLSVSRLPLTGTPCLYVSKTGDGCRMSCPTVTCAPAPVAASCKPPLRPALPGDEYLCDGGDDGRLATATAKSNVGIEPQDAIVQFGIGDGPNSRKMLPTNIVCLYAPRFAATEVRTGANENIIVQGPVMERNLQPLQGFRNRELGVKLTLNQPPVMNRVTQRASGIINRQTADAKIELRVLGGFDSVQLVKVNEKLIPPQILKGRDKAMLAENKIRPIAIKTAESVVVTGIEQSASEKVMAWKPQEDVGTEPVPGVPGLMVIKRVSKEEATPGEEVEFTIEFRNMGNVSIRSVSVIDSLLPRLEYIKGSALGPKGTVFTANANEAGSTELRWDLPNALAPGESGKVSFKATVR